MRIWCNSTLVFLIADLHAVMEKHNKCEKSEKMTKKGNLGQFASVFLQH